MAITATRVVQTQAPHPHLDEIKDFPTMQAIRLLGDRLQSALDRVTAAEGTITSLVTLVNQLEGQLAAAQRDLGQALGPTQET